MTYVYKKNPVVEGSVTAHYEDETGEKISDDVVLKGNIDETYTTEQKKIDGYTFKEVKAGSADITGSFTAQAQEVTYVYKKNVVEDVSGTLNNRTPSATTINSNYDRKKLPSTGETKSFSVEVIGICLLALVSGMYFINKKRIKGIFRN